MQNAKQFFFFSIRYYYCHFYYDIKVSHNPTPFLFALYFYGAFFTFYVLLKLVAGAQILCSFLISFLYL